MTDPRILCALIKDKGCGERYFVISFVGQKGPDAKLAVPALVEAAKDIDPQIRQAAADALKTIDPQVAAKAGIK